MKVYRVEYRVGATERHVVLKADDFQTKGDWLLAVRTEVDGIEWEIGRWPASSVIQVLAVEEPRDGD